MMYKTMTQTMYGTTKTFVIRDNGNGSFTSFSDDPANTDYAEYLRWIEAGNTPLPADEQE